MLEKPDFLGCLRLDDHFGTKRWLAARRVFWELKDGGAYECEKHTLWIPLESNLERLVYPGNSSWGLPAFAERADSPFDLCGLSRLREHELVPGVMAAVRDGYLVVIRQTGAALDPAAKARAEAWRIARDVEALTKGKLRCSGRRYTLCAQGQIDRSMLGLTRRLLVPREATTVLDRMIEEYAAQPGLVALFKQARPMLRTGADGTADDAELVLLRHLVVASPRGIDQAPVTPSQMRQEAREKAKLNFEVVVVGLDDRPLAGLEYTVKTPDGETVSGSLGGGAKTRTSSIKPGTVEVVLSLANGDAAQSSD